ncbi:hypothetical protein ABKV19_001971 [Rosa sericea]
MAPRKPHNLSSATSNGEEETPHHRLRRRSVHHGQKSHEHDLKKKKEKKKKSRVTEKVKKKKKKKKLKLNEVEGNKSLYLSTIEYQEGERAAYSVRCVKLSDLLCSSDDDPVQLRQVAYAAGDHLPASIGGGVFGSQIIFAGGVKPSFPIISLLRSDLVWHRDVYAFETDPNKQQPQPHDITRMDATLLQAKFYPLIVELGGKLYALSGLRVSDPPSFEVFDPNVGKWAALPEPPFFQIGSRYWEDAEFSYAITGTKIFASHEKCPVFCFDVAHPDREWRLVSTMCHRRPFPFRHKTLVLDLPEDDKKKLLFACTNDWRLGVYILSLDENQESITQIGDWKIPSWPYEFGYLSAFSIVHIGGQKACFVVTRLGVPSEYKAEDEPGTHKTFGIAIPFQFDLDITKVDKDKKNCLTLQFMYLRIFEYHTNPSSFPEPGPVGCFVL